MPTVPGPRRDARDRRRRGGRAGRARPSAEHDAAPPRGRGPPVGPSSASAGALEDVLVGGGFSEAYTWSLVPSDPDPAALRLPDPMSGEHAVLRTTLLHGLVEAARVNVDAGNSGIRLFEIARVYLPSGGQLPDEHWHVGGIAAGGFAAARGSRRDGLRDVPPAARAAADDAPAPSPGQGGRDGRRLARRAPPDHARGRVGGIRAGRRAPDDSAPRPDPLRGRDHVPGRAAGRGRRGRRGGSRPASIVAVAREAGGAELRDARVFDVYHGDQVGKRKKSVALHLVFQASDRTLTDEDADTARVRIVRALGDRLGAELRT